MLMAVFLLVDEITSHCYMQQHTSMAESKSNTITKLISPPQAEKQAVECEES